MKEENYQAGKGRTRLPFGESEKMKMEGKRFGKERGIGRRERECRESSRTGARDKGGEGKERERERERGSRGA